MIRPTRLSLLPMRNRLRFRRSWLWLAASAGEGSARGGRQIARIGGGRGLGGDRRFGAHQYAIRGSRKR